MEIFIEPIYDISKIDNNEIKIKHIIKKSIENCDITILGIPYDGLTFGRPGARYAPKFIREYLYSLNTYSYNEDLDLAVFSICDFGDVNVSHTDYEFTNNNIYKATYVCYEKSKLTIILGGDHSITYPSFLSLKDFIKKGLLGLLIFDAHHDIRELKENYDSSGSFLKKILNKEERLKIVQLGIRDFYNPKYYATKAKGKIKFYTIEEIRKKDIIKEVKEFFENIEALYISVDFDVIDAFYIKGVNSPSFNGLNPNEMINLLNEFLKMKKVKVIDIVEINPIIDDGFSSKFAAYVALKCMATFLKYTNSNLK
jgi:Arginase/agmatinase/formimionoglutamate hydrolase, arginase family